MGCLETQKHRERPHARLVCADCMDKGFTALDVRGYLCTDCDNSWGRGKFFTKEFQNAAERNRYENLRCIECHDLLRCVACQKGFPKSYWSKKEREHHTERKSRLVCKDCRVKGCTAWNVRLYTCTTCNEQKGSALFSDEAINNYTSHDRQSLVCKRCVEASKAREKALRLQLRNSKRYCKCFCIYHTEKCPLSPVCFGEKRWPGCDGFITTDERIFLDSLRPIPSWWQKAWGRKG